MKTLRLTAGSTAVAAGKKPKMEHVYDVVAIFKSLKTDAVLALRRAGFKVNKIRNKGSFFVNGFDLDKAKTALTEAGFKVKQAKDRHKNTNLIIDRVFKDFMNLDLQVCSITSKGTLFTPPKRLSGLEVKMLKALLKSGVYQPRAGSRPEATAGEAVAAVPPEVAALGFDASGRLPLLDTGCFLKVRWTGKQLSVDLLDPEGSSYSEAYTRDLHQTGIDNYMKAFANCLTDIDNVAHESMMEDAAAELDEDDYQSSDEYDAAVSALADKWTKTDKNYLSVVKLQGKKAQVIPLVQKALEGLLATHPKSESSVAEASEWTDFLKGKMGKGKSLKELSKEFKALKAKKDGGEVTDDEGEDAEASATIDPKLETAWCNYESSLASVGRKPFRREIVAKKDVHGEEIDPMLTKIGNAFDLPVVGDTVSILYKTKAEAQKAMPSVAKTIAENTPFKTKPDASLRDVREFTMSNEDGSQSIMVRLKENFILVSLIAVAQPKSEATASSDDDVQDAYTKLKPALTSTIASSLDQMGLATTNWMLVLNGSPTGNPDDMIPVGRPNHVALQAIRQKVMPKVANILAGNKVFNLEDCSFVGFGGEVPVLPFAANVPQFQNTDIGE